MAAIPVNRLVIAVIYLYHMNNCVPASNHPTNYPIDLCWLARRTHSFLVVPKSQRRDDRQLMTSMHSESFCIIFDSPTNKQKRQIEERKHTKRPQ